MSSTLSSSTTKTLLASFHLEYAKFRPFSILGSFQISTTTSKPDDQNATVKNHSQFSGNSSLLLLCLMFSTFCMKYMFLTMKSFIFGRIGEQHIYHFNYRPLGITEPHGLQVGFFKTSSWKASFEISQLFYQPTWFGTQSSHSCTFNHYPYSC